MSKNEAKKAAPAAAKAKPTLVEGEAPASKKGGKKVVLLVKGQEVPRADYIRSLWTEKKMSRAEITKAVNEIITAQGGKVIPYQIVFAATKGIVGGPDKVEAADEE